MPVVVVATPVEVGEGEVDAETARGGIEHADAFRHHFAADAVAGDDGDGVCGHALVPVGSARLRQCGTAAFIEGLYFPGSLPKRP